MTIKEVIEKAGYERGTNSEGYMRWFDPDDGAGCEFISENDAFAHYVGRTFLNHIATFNLVWAAASLLYTAMKDLVEAWDQKEKDNGIGSSDVPSSR